MMFGWEFPPYNKGGLGTACHGLTKSLAKKGADVTFIIPYGKNNRTHVTLLSADSRITIKGIQSQIAAYMTPDEYYEMQISSGDSNNEIYGRNLFEEVDRYAKKAAAIARRMKFDIIHAHDWMTCKAAIETKKATNKPLVLHVHATEFDRTGGNGVHQYVYEIEKQGMQYADKIIAVSNFTKNKIVQYYGINPDKIEVVHNGVEFSEYDGDKNFKIRENNKIVLFLGRITLQKGPDYFVETAKKVLDAMPNVTFLMAGSGDMEPRIINRAAELGIANKVLFTGHLTGTDIDKAYSMANLYVMPSVSEPFGITPLEALRNNTPVLISKQSGVSEVISHCLKADFWDINEMANKIISVLKYPSLHKTLSEHGNEEARNQTWDKAGDRCIEIYNRLI